MRFKSAIEYTRNRIALSEISNCGVPHIVVDDVLSLALLTAINDHWPNEEKFQPEIPGNYVCNIRRRRYWKLNRHSRNFWIGFNELFWPSLVASCGERLIGPLDDIFGELLNAFRYAKTLTLMEAESTFPEHAPHTHFYHNPNWAFTVLLYVDPSDLTSEGTTLHNLESPSSHRMISPSPSNYISGNIEERVNCTMRTLNWSALPVARTISYKQGRLLIMLDGPLSLHSVQKNKPVTELALSPNQPRRIRRILRTHTCVQEARFYESMASKSGHRFSPKNFQREFISSIGKTAENTMTDTGSTPIRSFVLERLNTYASMVKKIQDQDKVQMKEHDNHSYKMFLNQLRLHQW
jgi:hypothetical protein